MKSYGAETTDANIALFILDSTYLSILQNLVETFKYHVSETLHDSTFLLFTFEPVVELLLAGSTVIQEKDELQRSLIPSVFVFAWLLPQCYEQLEQRQHSVFANAKKIWASWVSRGSSLQEATYQDICQDLKGLLKETNVRVL